MIQFRMDNTVTYSYEVTDSYFGGGKTAGNKDLAYLNQQWSKG